MLKYLKIISVFLVLCILQILYAQKVWSQATEEVRVFKYHIVSSVPVNHLSPGKILGITNKEIVSTKILKGKLPESLIMLDDGTLTVKDDQYLEPGKYKIKVEFVDVEGNNFTEKVLIELLKAVDYTDQEASVRIAKPKLINPKLANHYKAGDIIAQFRDPDSTIKKAKLIKGALPDGVEFMHNKNFIVTQPNLLKSGEYFCLFMLIDEKEGNTVLAVSLPIGL